MLAPMVVAPGSLGGGAGGAGQRFCGVSPSCTSRAAAAGEGPGGGQSGATAGGGSYGGLGGGSSGPVYVPLPGSLLAGSGGADGRALSTVGGTVTGLTGGAGGGALEIGALGSVTLGAVTAAGQAGGNGSTSTIGPNLVTSRTSGSGAGSGGAVVVHGSTINAASLSAIGGLGGDQPDEPNFRGGSGGGGRLSIQMTSYRFGETILGQYSVAGGGGPIPGGEGTVAFVVQNAFVGAGKFAELGVSPFPGATFSVNTIVIETGGIALAKSPSLLFRGIALQGGGMLIAPSGLQIANDQAIGGSGTVLGTVGVARGGSVIASGGTLSIGDASRADAFASDGTLRAGNGATLQLQSASAVTIQHQVSLGANGRLAALNGVSLANAGVLTAEGNGVVDGAFVNAGTVQGPTSGELRFLSGVSGSGIFTGHVAFAGVFSPGNSPGVVTLENMTLESTAELVIELQGATPGTGAGFHDQVNVTHDAALDGLLRLSFQPGFLPQVGQQYVVLTWGTRTGQFADIDILGLAPDLALVPLWGATSLSFQVTAVPEASLGAMWIAGLILMMGALRRRSSVLRSGG